MKTKSLLNLKAVLLMAFAAILISSCQDKPADYSTLDFKKSPNNISAKQANKMEELYKKHQYAIINNSLKIKDHREYWFALKELKSYIAYIEQNAAENNYDKAGLGIRVYNAAKMEEGKVKSSIFIIGTHNGKVKTNKGSFNPINSALLLQQPPNQNMKGDAFNFGSSGDPDPLEFN